MLYYHIIQYLIGGKEMKKISVIVPVYNVEQYLDRCVQSILNQSYGNLEIILVDDGSTDESGKICDKYSTDYEMIRTIHKENGGLSSARNAALDVYTGDFVSFIDSDDWIEPDMYSNMMNIVNEDKSDIVICRRFRVDENNHKTLENYMKYPSKAIMNREEALACLMSFRGFDMSVCDKLFSNKVIDDIRFPYGKTCEDSFTTYKYFSNANIISYTQTSYYNYFYRLNSITRNSSINKTVIEATEEQRKYIINKYPKLKNEANTSCVYAYLSVYNSYLQRTRKCEELRKYQDEVRNVISSVLSNKNISFTKKIQILLFVNCPKLYNLFTLRKLEKVK